MCFFTHGAHEFCSIGSKYRSDSSPRILTSWYPQEYQELNIDLILLLSSFLTSWYPQEYQELNIDLILLLSSSQPSCFSSQNFSFSALLQIPFAETCRKDRAINRVSNRNSVEHNCAKLHAIVLELHAITHNFQEVTGLAITRK